MSERPPDDDTAPSHPLIALFRQLGARHVLRTAGLYCVGAWALVQVLSTVQPALDLPPILVTITILLAIAGFLPACILAWAYDLAPPRLLRAQPLPGEAPRVRHRMAAMLVALAGVVFLGAAAAGWAVWRSHARNAALVAAAGAAQAALAQFPPDHVAVLEFEDRSPAHDRAYLAGALTESLIDQLSRVPALHVVSRGGVGSYAGAQVSYDSIGRALHVGTIIKGSVLEDRGLIRVVVRAVDAASSEILATSSPQRPAGELLPLIDDIVAEVSGMIRQHVGAAVEARSWQAGTSNEEAWRLVQSARQLRDDSDKLSAQGDVPGAVATLRRADSLLAAAERYDSRWNAPLLERGWVARKVGYLLWVGQRDPAGGQLEFARGIAHANQVLQRDPSDAAAYELRGILEWWTHALSPGRPGDAQLTAAAQHDLREALRYDVKRPLAWSTLGSLLVARADWAGASAAIQRAYDEDAYLEGVIPMLSLAFRSAFELGDDAEARRWCDELERRASGEAPAADCRLELMAFVPSGVPDPAAAWKTRNAAGKSDPPQIAAMNRQRLDLLVAAVLARAGLRDSAEAVIARARAVGPSNPNLLPVEAGARVLLGERAQAVKLLRAYAQAAPDVAPGVLRGRIFRGLRTAPELGAVLHPAPDATRAAPGR